MNDESYYVSNLSALERLGGAQEIVISKSGVLTKNGEGIEIKTKTIFAENRLIDNDIETRFI